MAKELSVLQQQAEAIKTEVNKGANTSSRIGGMFGDMLEYNEEKLTELETDIQYSLATDSLGIRFIQGKAAITGGGDGSDNGNIVNNPDYNMTIPCPISDNDIINFNKDIPYGILYYSSYPCNHDSLIEIIFPTDRNITPPQGAKYFICDFPKNKSIGYTIYKSSKEAIYGDSNIIGVLSKNGSPINNKKISTPIFKKLWGKKINGIYIDYQGGSIKTIVQDVEFDSDGNYNVKDEKIINIYNGADKGIVYIPIEMILQENQMISIQGTSAFTYNSFKYEGYYEDGSYNKSSSITINVLVDFSEKTEIQYDFIKSTKKLIGVANKLELNKIYVCTNDEFAGGYIFSGSLSCGENTTINLYDCNTINLSTFEKKLIKTFQLNKGEQEIDIYYQLPPNHTIGLEITSGEIYYCGNSIFTKKFSVNNGDNIIDISSPISLNYCHYEPQKGKWNGFYYSPGSQLNVNVKDTISADTPYYYGGMLLQAIRTHGVSGIALFAQNKGTISLIVAENVGNSGYNTISQKDIEIQNIGFNIIKLDEKINISNNQFFGIGGDVKWYSSWRTNSIRTTTILQVSEYNPIIYKKNNIWNNEKRLHTLGVTPLYDNEYKYYPSDLEKSDYMFKLAGKRMSLITDSISAFSGYIKDGNSGFYPKFDVTAIAHMWWCKLFANNEVLLGTLDCYSGSAVRKGSTYSAIDNQRWNNIICPDGSIPDIAITYIGTNDFPYAQVGEIKIVDDDSEELSEFSQAYVKMCQKICDTYPKITLINLSVSPRNSPSEFPSKSTSNNKTIYQWAEQQIKCADFIGVKSIDMTKLCNYASYGSNYPGFEKIYSEDGLHPNKNGQSLLVEYILKNL